MVSRMLPVFRRERITRYTEHKQLHPEYIGQRKMYSVAEIERVRIKEREAPKLIFREKKR